MNYLKMIKKLLGNGIRAIIRFKLLRSRITAPSIEKQLSDVLSKAKNLKAYEKILTDYKDQGSGVDVINYFKQIPILTKEDLKINPSHFKFDGVNYHEVRTGGSTGEPLLFFQDYHSRKAQKRNMYLVLTRRLK